MLRVIGAIVFLVLAYTVVMLADGYLSASAALRTPLFGLAAGWLAFAPNRKGEP